MRPSLLRFADAFVGIALTVIYFTGNIETWLFGFCIGWVAGTFVLDPVLKFLFRKHI